MGANGSSYPHSCSPRIGGNAQGQQTFIGKFFSELKMLKLPQSNSPGPDVSNHFSFTFTLPLCISSKCGSMI